MYVYLSNLVFNFTTDGPQEGLCCQLSFCRGWGGWMDIHRSFSCVIHLLTYGLHVSDVWFTRICDHNRVFLLSVPPGDWTKGFGPWAQECRQLSLPITHFRRCEISASAGHVILPYCASVSTFFTVVTIPLWYLMEANILSDSICWLAYKIT